MFNRDYLEKLKQYVGKDIQLVESDNEVHIYLDSEIQYFLRKKEQKYILYVSERGKETEEKIYTSEVDMKRNFALWVKSNFSENIKYPFSKQYRISFRDIPAIEPRILLSAVTATTDLSFFSIFNLSLTFKESKISSFTELNLTFSNNSIQFKTSDPRSLPKLIPLSPPDILCSFLYNNYIIF